MTSGPYYDSILKGEWVRDAQGRYIHPITKQPITQDQYLQTAYTQDAINTRNNIQQINAAKAFTSQPRSAVENMQYMGANNLTLDDFQRLSGKSKEQLFPTIYDYEGRGYSSYDLLKAAAQIGPKLNASQSKGGVFGTSGQSIGFDYGTLSSLFPKDVQLSAADQVVFDISRGLLNKGVTNLDDLSKVVHKANMGRGNYYWLFPPDTPFGETISQDSANRFHALRGYAGYKALWGKQDSISLGETYTGDGGTGYYFNPNLGAQSIATYPINTSDAQSIAFALSLVTLGMGGPAALGSFITGGAATGMTAAAIGSAALSFTNNLIMGASPLDALKNTVKSGGAAYLASMVGAMLPTEIAAVGSSAVSQLIQTGKIDLTTLAIAGAQGAVTNALSTELGIPKDIASTLSSAGLNALSGREQAAIQILANGAINSAINKFAGDNKLTNEQKNWLALGVGQAVQIARGGEFNPSALLIQLAATGLNEAARKAIATTEAKDRFASMTVDQVQRLKSDPETLNAVRQLTDNPDEIFYAGKTQQQIDQIDFGITDYAEAAAFLGELGYNPTDAEIRQFVGQVNEDAARVNIESFVATKEGWANPSERAAARNTYGADVTPEKYRKLSPYIGQAVGDDNVANQFKSSFGKSGVDGQFYEFGLDPDEFRRLDTIDEALQTGQSAFITAAIDAYSKGTMSESELRSELRAAGISDSNTSTLVNVAKDSAAKQEKVNTVFRDLLDPGSDLSLEGAAIRLKESGLTDTQVSSAIQSITNDFSKASELRTRTDQIIDDYTAWNSDLSREKALERLVTAGVGATRANELLGLVDTQVESQRYLKEVGREAVQRYAAGDISREDAELALQKGSFPVQTVKTMIEYANAVKEGRQLTPGEMEVAAANNLNQWFKVGSGYQVRVARAEDGTLGLVEARDPLGRDVTRDIFLDPKTNTITSIASIPKTVSKAIDDPRMYKGFDTSIYVPDIVGRLGLPPGTASNNEVIALINEWNAATPTERRQLAKDPLMQGLKMINDEKLKSAEVPWQQRASNIIKGSSGSLTSGLSNWALAGQDLAKAIQDTESLITGKPPGEASAWFNRTGAEMLNAVSGVLAYGGSKSLAPDLKQASDIIKGIGSENSEIATSINDFTKRLDSIPDWRDKAYEAAAFVYKDPVAVLSWALSEVAQDGPAMLAYGLANAGKLTAASLASGLETLGGAYWDAREAALNENKSITEANNLANKAATQAAAATLAIGGAFDAKSIKALDDLRAGRITQQTAKSTLEETFDEGTTNLLVQSTATGTIDPSKLGTAAVTGGLIGGVAGGKTAALNEGVMGNVTVLALNPANNTAVLMGDKFEPYVVSMENRNLQLGQSYLFNPSNFLVQQQINDAISSNRPMSEVISDQIANAIAVNAPLSIVTQGIFDSDAVRANPVNGVTETINAAFANNINPDSILASVFNSALDISGPTDQQIIDAAIGSMLAADRSIEDTTRSLVNASINSGLSYNAALNDVTSSLMAKSTDPAATLGQIIPIASQVGLTAGQTPADVANAVLNTALQAGSTANLNATDTLSNAIDQTYASLIAGGLTPDQASIILGSAASQSGTSNNLTTADVLTSINTGITQAGGNTQLATANVVSGQLTGLQTQYNQLSEAQKQIADNLVDQGITLQEAITRAKSELSTEIGEVRTDLQAKIDNLSTEQRTQFDSLSEAQKELAIDLANQGTDLATAINTAVSELGTQIGEVRTDFETKYNALSESQKAQFDTLTAAQQDIVRRMADQGTALQDAIAQTKSSLETQIGGVQSDLQTKYDALTASQKQIADDLIDQGKTLQEAIDQAVSQLGTEIGGVKTEIGEVKTDFQTKYDALTQTQKEQFDGLTQGQKDLAAQLAAQGTDLATAINSVKTELKTEIGDVKTGLETQIGDIKTQIGNKIDALAKTSADADQVLKGSIDSVAADLGLTREQLLTQLGTTEANLKTEFKTQLDTVQTALQQQIQQQTQQIEKQTAQQKEDARLQRIATGSAAALAIPGLMGQATKQPFIESPSLKSEVTGGIEDPLAKFMNIIQGEPEKAPEVPTPPLGGDMSNYTYGQQPPSYDELFSNQEFAEDPEFMSREELILPYKAGGSPLNIQMMYAKGGEPREDFRHGKHVAGPGDGQSDDIPAWLADGEFVFPADVVSALGNGSTKAGTEKLYDMMHAIRKRARSKGPKDLPPAALKSPLDYLKG